MTETPKVKTPVEVPVEKGAKSCGSGASDFLQGAIWWAMLVMAVLAIPALSMAVTLALPIGETSQLFVFMITCWLCTWLGMWLMKKAK